ncbi:MAG: glycoside hydrolase family 13 protein [FCB group bacterium]|nr:glycoside hydrolase family 13 protein [FCB group bacterium]
MKKLFIFSLLLVFACGLRHSNTTNQIDTNPEWAKDAIWYQIFPERFWNGDPSNDPTINTLTGTWPYDQQTDWDITPWTDDWYKLQPWEKANGRGFYYNAQLRRYGGDLQGIINKLDYLQSLGINAIYLNPIFESASSHKYGATYFHHIDNNFGPDPIGDEKIWAREDHGDPDSWQFTAADKLFHKLIQEVHKRDMHIIIDGVFNHAGIPFWALEDVRKNGKSSKYAEWFTITKWDDPDTPENEFDYHGWNGIRDLPELKEDEGGLIDPIADYFHAVVKRWMDPNNDGDPSDGIDGWRLDVAEKVSLNFWKKLRSWTNEINPESYLTGEVWWEDYNAEKMFNAAPWLQGDAFHSVMNYRFGDAMYRFFIWEKRQINANELGNLLQGYMDEYGYENVLQIQNLIGSHDNERLASACVNVDLTIDHASNVQYNNAYQVRKPNLAERKKQECILAFQFAFPGAPYIYYGDEVGMWGGDDPDERKPMVWGGLKYEDETTHPLNHPRKRDAVEVDKTVLAMYKDLIKMRNEHPALRRGTYEMLLADDDRGIFAFSRKFENDEIIAIFNGSSNNHKFSLVKILDGSSNPAEWQPILTNSLNLSSDRAYPLLTAKSFMIYARD